MGNSDSPVDHARRQALRGLAAAGATLAFATQMARAAHEAHAAASSGGPFNYTLLGPADAADVEALTAQIVPSDDSPGAREAGVAFFIDKALGSFFAHWRPSFMAGLTDFRSRCRAYRPETPFFSALTSADQIAFLHTVDTMPFFDQARVLTACGMFASPQYGGNRGGIGWQLLGFEDTHGFQPPFGFYDREPA